MAEAFVSEETAEGGSAAETGVGVKELKIGTEEIVKEWNGNDYASVDGKIQYVKESNTLILNNAHITEPIHIRGYLTILLKEGTENTIEVLERVGPRCTEPIHIHQVDLEYGTVGGTVTITGSEGTAKERSEYGKLIVKSGSFNAISTIDAFCGINIGKAQIEIVSDSKTGDGMTSYGIHSQSILKIEDSNVNVQAEGAINSSEGIEIKKSKINAEGLTANAINGPITVETSEIIAKGNAGIDSSVSGDFKFKNSTLDVEAKTIHGIQGKGNIEFDNSTVEITVLPGSPYWKSINVSNAIILTDENYLMEVGTSESDAVKYSKATKPTNWNSKHYVKITPSDTAYHTITLTDGTASASTGGIQTTCAAKDEIVTITAKAAPTGKRFKEWKVISGGVTLADSSSAATTFTMPATAVSIETVYEDASYAITVEKGTANVAESKAGETITITANPAPEGKVFKEWKVISGEVTLADSSRATTTFTMPATAVSIEAIYEDAVYGISVENGTANVTESKAGETITITANPAPEGKVFKEWKVISGGVTLEDSSNATTTFTMPATEVSIEAVYEDASYAITVENGTANVTESKAGETITIIANPAPYDYSFYKWEVVSGNITLANPWSRTTTFAMPMANVSVKATYYYDPYIPPTTPSPTPDPIPENFPEGSERNPDGSITTPNGTEVDKDGTITLPDGTELKPDEDGNKPTIDKDNNVTDTNGTVIDKDGNITLPGKNPESAEDDTKVETGTGTKPPKYDPETGNVTTEDGNKVTLPGGQEITPPAGSVVEKDGTITEPDGTVVAPDGTITKPDGTVIDPDGTIHNTDGSIQSSDGTYLRPATPMLESAEIGVSGNQVKAILSGECAGAEGYDYVISENINCIVDKDYLARSRNILKTDTAFYYIPAGTYYVYCHAYTRDENGKKVFSEWSNYRMVTVTAITPEIPEITDVRVKGRNVIVTYTNCENADGYDIILGRAYKSVNGEKRPVDYIPYVQKIKNGNTTTAIFRNVPKGRYFAGLHAWNRTSEDGKKVFSPWSKSRRVIVK